MKSRSKHAQNGFALIEVLVAVAIIGLALPALLFNVMARLDGVAYMRERTIASWVASNQLTELHVKNMDSGEILNGSAEGVEEMAGSRWGWSAESEETNTNNLYRVKVQVWRDDDPLRSTVAEMTSYMNDFLIMFEVMDTE